MKSWTADSSRRNSGLDTTANGAASGIVLAHDLRHPVPRPDRDGALEHNGLGPAQATGDGFGRLMHKGQVGFPSTADGVPIATKVNSARCSPSSWGIVKAWRYAAELRRTISSRPGSLMGRTPAFNCAIFSSLTSNHTTVFHRSAGQASVTSPTYPTPMTHAALIAAPQMPDDCSPDPQKKAKAAFRYSARRQAAPVYRDSLGGPKSRDRWSPRAGATARFGQHGRSRGSRGRTVAVQRSPGRDGLWSPEPAPRG
jgi:hypothetical protein